MEHGIYHNIPFEEYKKWGAINNTILVKILKESPAHAKQYIDNPTEQSKAFLLGGAAHKLILEPFDFDKDYIVAPEINKRTKQGKLDYENFLESANGKTVINQEIFEAIQNMERAIGRHSLANEILSRSGSRELSLVWECEGVLAKERIDLACDDIIVDLKTTACARPESFARAAITYSYDQQMAFYADGYQSITGIEPTVIIIAIEKEPPYGISVHQMTESVLQQGRESYQKAIEIYKQCLVFNDWPSYAEEINLI